MKLFAAVLAICLLAQPLVAQSTNCRAQWAKINDLLINFGVIDAALPGLVRERADGGCRIDGIDIPADRYLTFATDRIEWSGTDLDRFVTDALPPRSLNLAISGITIRPDIGDKALNYLNQLQNQGKEIDLSLAVTWDEAARTLSLNRLNLSFPGDDYVHVSALVEGVDLNSLSTIQMSAGSFGLTRMTAEIRSVRLFQDYILQPFGFALLYNSDDPETRIEELKTQASDILDGMPSDLLPPASKRALLSLVADMPTPAGTLRLDAAADPGLGMARFLPLAMRRSGIAPTDLWNVLDGVRLDATYRPE